MTRVLLCLVFLVVPILAEAQPSSIFANDRVQAGATCPPTAIPAGGTGTVYTCTGSGALYTWTGSAWINTVAGAPSSTIFSGHYESTITDIDGSDFTAPALAGAGAGNVSNGTHRYKFSLRTNGGTYGTADSGTPTAAVTVVDNSVNGQVTVTIPYTCTGTNYPYVYVYRDKNSDGVYKEVGNNNWDCSTAFTDNVADGSLGAVMPTSNTAVNGFLYDAFGGLSGFGTDFVTNARVMLGDNDVSGQILVLSGREARNAADTAVGIGLSAGNHPSGSGSLASLGSFINLFPGGYGGGFDGAVVIEGGISTVVGIDGGDAYLAAGGANSGATGGDAIIQGGRLYGGGGSAGSILLQTDNTTRLTVGPTGTFTYAGPITMGAGLDITGSTYTSAGGASPVAVTVKPGAATGTNTAGAALSIESGLGTGNATPSTIAVKLPVTGASGTDAQTQVTKALYYNKVYSMPDATAVNLANVTLATDDTGCAVHTSFTYTVTNGTNTASHSGTVVWAIVNQNGTVTTGSTDSGEAVAGTGCGAACDTWSSSIAGTTATLRGAFDNSLAATGSLTYQVLNNSCTAFSPL